MPAANWTATAPEVTARYAIANGYLDLSEVCHHAGLAPATIRDALSRPEIEDQTVPLGALARPAARIGGVASPSPMWSPAQIAEYDRRRAAQADAGSNQRTPDLPIVTREEAEAQELASIDELAEVLGVAPNTLRRWSRTYRTAQDGRAAFPPEVAMARREPPHHRGRQHRLRSRTAVIQWVLDHAAVGTADEDVAVAS